MQLSGFVNICKCKKWLNVISRIDLGFRACVRYWFCIDRPHHPDRYLDNLSCTDVVCCSVGCGMWDVGCLDASTALTPFLKRIITVFMHLFSYFSILALFAVDLLSNFTFYVAVNVEISRNVWKCVCASFKLGVILLQGTQTQKGGWWSLSDSEVAKMRTKRAENLRRARETCTRVFWISPSILTICNHL